MSPDSSESVSAHASSAGAFERRVAVLALVLATLLFVGLRLLYLELPLSRDEGEYAYVAQHCCYR